MIRTAFYIAVFIWLARLFVRGCYRTGFAIGWTLTRIALGLIAGVKMLFRGLRALAVREIVPAPAERGEAPAEQRAELLDQHVDELHRFVALHRRVVPDEARRYSRRMVIHPSRKRR